MTLPWIIAGAVVGLAAGPRIRACAFSRGTESDPAQRQRLEDILASLHRVTHLGMPDFRPSTGRSSGATGGP